MSERSSRSLRGATLPASGGAEAKGDVMKKIRRREARPRCLRRQRDVLCDVMLSAGQCETWLTLHELGRLTGYGEASVSAQLRHLRKPEFGGYEVDKRQRSLGRAVRSESGPLWEYRLRRRVRAECKRPTVQQRRGRVASVR